MSSRDTLGERMTVHGHTAGRTASPTYRSWYAMKTRCNNPNAKRYGDYGGKGVRVCQEWDSFEKFLADMGERPVGRTLDRFPDGTGDYSRSNCRWATAAEQCRNKLNNRPVVRSDGASFKTTVEAAEAVGGRKGGVRDACTGRQKTHRGFSWSYAS